MMVQDPLYPVDNDAAELAGDLADEIASRCTLAHLSRRQVFHVAYTVSVYALDRHPAHVIHQNCLTVWIARSLWGIGEEHAAQEIIDACFPTGCQQRTFADLFLIVTRTRRPFGPCSARGLSVRPSG